MRYFQSRGRGRGGVGFEEYPVMAAELFRFMEMAEADAAVDERDIALVTIVEVDGVVVADECPPWLGVGG